MKRKTFVWVVLFGSFVALSVLMLAYSSVQREIRKLGRVDIRIDRHGSVYLQEQDVRMWLQEHGLHLEGKPMVDVIASNVEKIVEENPFVARVEVYPSGDSVLYLDVEQRNPALKVLNSDQVLFQIDENGVEMPVNPRYTARVRVATGNIPCKPSYGDNVRDLSDSLARSVLKKLYGINSFLWQDPLWDAMFEQIYVTGEGEFELVPKVGGQLVKLGGIETEADLAAKMEKLKLFYLHGMGDHGWEKYSVLDLRYRDQLVATRKKGM